MPTLKTIFHGIIIVTISFTAFLVLGNLIDDSNLFQPKTAPPKEQTAAATLAVSTMASSTPDNLLQLLLLHPYHLYFSLPDGQDDCGATGNCLYHVFASTPTNNLALEPGFDTYLLDCATGKVSFTKDTAGLLFGDVTIDAKNRIIKAIDVMGYSQSAENIYSVSNTAAVTLIASYDHICSDKVMTLYRNKQYPATLTKF